LGRFGQQGLEVSPLGIGKVGLINGVFHAPTEASLKISRRNPRQMSTDYFTFLPRAIKSSRKSKSYPKLIIQTDS
jgi:hypothetical protein